MSTAGLLRATLTVVVLVLLACTQSSITAPASASNSPVTVTAASAAMQAASPPSTIADATPLSFSAATFVDEISAFALDYPSNWNLTPTSQMGARGRQALLFSPGSTMQAVANGGSLIAMTTYHWEPTNDLDAWAALLKTAWDASGFAITSEDSVQLADGRAASLFMVNTPIEPTFILLTTIGEDYLQVSGEGDLALAEEIARTLRPME